MGFILFSALLALAAVYDLKWRIVPDWIHPALAAAAVFTPGGLQVTGVMAALPLFAAGMCDGSIGGGDIKLVAACGLFLGLKRTGLGLFLGLALFVIVCGIFKPGYGKKGEAGHTGRGQAYPLVPFLFPGMVLAYFL